jgi:transposase
VKQYLSISEVAQLLGVTEKWIYKHSKKLNPARAMLNGRPSRPVRFDPDRLEAILSGSLKTEKTSDLHQKVGRL